MSNSGACSFKKIFESDPQFEIKILINSKISKLLKFLNLNF